MIDKDDEADLPKGANASLNFSLSDALGNADVEEPVPRALSKHVTVVLPREDAVPDTSEPFNSFRYNSNGGRPQKPDAAAAQREVKKIRTPEDFTELLYTSQKSPPPRSRLLNHGLRHGRVVLESEDDLSPSPHWPGKRPRATAIVDSEEDPSPALQRRKVAGLQGDDEASSDEDGPATAARRMLVDLTQDEDAEPVDDLEEVGEELQADHLDDVLQKCAGISDKLRSVLGGTQGDRYAAVDESPATMVTHEQLVRACGDAARYFKSYQLIGVNFLMLLARSGVGGSILADEMGLGKTAQAICFLGVLRELERDEGPHLVVAPASLLENWEREFQRWCPGLKVQAYYGKERIEVRHELNHWRHQNGYGKHADRESDSEAEGDDSGDEAFAGSDNSDDEDGNDGDSRPGPAQPQWRGAQGSKVPPARPKAPFNVLLTCYTLFERDSQEQKWDRAFLQRWQWSHLLMDEAHAVKNRNAARTKRLRRLAASCQRRIMLTGTPLQNDLEELQNLLQFLLPDVFREEEASQLESIQDEEALEKLTQRMKRLLGPFVLRRLKSEVANQLAAKQHRVELVAMEAEQQRMYDDAVSHLRAEVRGVTSQAEASTSGQDDAAREKRQREAERWIKRLGKQKINNMFTHLRKIAQHPLLVRHAFSDARVAEMARLAHARGVFGGGAGQERVREELLGYSDFSLHAFALANGRAFRKFLLDPSHALASGKCRLLAKLLPELQERGSRPLIFSQWTAVLDVLELLLDQLQLPYVRLDGSTAVADRLRIVDQFNNHKEAVFAFLLSTRAGGQGLNLTGADTVILHDVDFNPQIDRQAEDRCHRLGQTRPVTVYRLVSRGTVDEGIHGLAQRKLRLDAAVLDGITVTGAETSKKAGAAETAHMGELLRALISGGPAESAAGQAGEPEVVAESEDEGPVDLT
ncbi:hypothetical protein WJX72_000080 [[Myrmecia] bisecta]|uniref:Uncharacterized protein n=1 Tax=[Myrmecia] bisecta TaxID=41462 RepID=A0AAW1QEE9_9CHLO